MPVHDLSAPLFAGMPEYPGDPPFESSDVATVAGDGYALRRLHLGSHTGTHLDAPAHFVPGGATVDQAPLDLLCGPARVLDARPAGRAIDAAFLGAQRLDGVVRLLLRTAPGTAPSATFDPDHAGLTPDAAAWLRVSTGIRLLGIDQPSIESQRAPGFPVHHALLDGPSPIWILEGLDLGAVPEGDGELLCLPLRLRGGDGAPARTVLRRP
jgi:arylformamidase